MQKVMGVTDVRNNLGAILSRIFRGEEHLVVEKSGIPVAVIISMKDYEEYRRHLAQSMLKDLGRKLGAEAEKKGLTEEKLIEALEEDRQAVYEEMYGKQNK